MEQAPDDPPSIPAGIRVRKDPEGNILLDLPASQEKFLRFFLLLFSLPFLGAGIGLLASGESPGLIPLVIGIGAAWFGAWHAFGRVEIRLGALELEWTRNFLRRWKTHMVARESIAGIRTQAWVRTNGRPTSWAIGFEGRRETLPGSYSEPVVLWLGGILSTWSQKPFDTRLDKSYQPD